MKSKWITFALALAFAVPGLAQKPAAEKITDGPKIEGVGDTWAIIAWTTNTGGSSVVKYGTDTNNLNQTAQSAYSDNEKSQSQNHRVRLKGLKPGTQYYYSVVSGQGEGTGTQATGPVANFTTKGTAGSGTPAGTPPGTAGQSGAVKITNGPKVEGVGPNWAIVAWTTNTGGSSLVRYGTDANSLTQTAQAAYADNEKSKGQNHRVHINNLKPNTKYYFVADSGQGEGTGTEAKSSVADFTTKAK
jgi:phosphodiesterase/alkaline phosphatase D-like protein